MRIFVGLDIAEEIRTHLSRFMDDMRRIEPNAKWVRPEAFHVTLKFVGEKPPAEVEDFKRELAQIQAQSVRLEFKGVGFFPTPRSPRVFWAGIHSDENLSALARAVDEASAKLGVAREEQEYRPHLTLARAGSGAPRSKTRGQTDRNLRRLAEQLPVEPPEFGTMTAQEFFLYESKLSPSGARYSKLARFPLRAG